MAPGDGLPVSAELISHKLSALARRLHACVYGCVLAYADCILRVNSVKSLQSSDRKDEYGEAAEIPEPIEAAWISKNYGDDLYLQCTYTCIRILDRRLDHASKKDKVRRHRPGRDEERPAFNAVYDTGKKLFLGACDSRGVGSVGVLVNTSLSMNIDSFEQLTTRIGRSRLKRRGLIPALKIFVAYHTFFKVIIGDFNAKIGPERLTNVTLGPTDWNGSNRVLSMVDGFEHGAACKRHPMIHKEFTARYTAGLHPDEYTFKENIYELVI
ncbi:unnamed protein product [Angiostrongylus costaricensis]|uniref:Craniofacial development protein 2-like n=1 Tax=Angiostrongylus costaricensis TaxID=334426 RepID=A0A0R3PRM4_ANGCS|nr:unnamed protein product [Angiostrongylus costaricensis]